MTINLNFDPNALADEALKRALRTQWDGEPLVCIDSPPGAGKTGTIERLAVQSLALIRERCIVATQTNRQSFELAERLATSYPKLSFYLFHKDKLELPPQLRGLNNLTCTKDRSSLPEGEPCVVIANAAKWSALAGPVEPYDVLLVDEAYQLTDVRFHQIAALARRFVLVGDPGQIAPVVSCDVDRWASDPSGPHVACPEALLARHPTAAAKIALPVSRRLVPDTVRFVQPSFYPDLPFVGLSAPDERGLVFRVAGAGPYDHTLDQVARGASLVMAELPAQTTGVTDAELASTIVGMVERLFEREAWVRTGLGAERRLEPRDVGIVCAHVAQVNAVTERLPERFASQILVETADRYQGLERPVMFAHHPLSGRLDPQTFHLEAGRLCVMLSRHSVACIVVGRAGVEARLDRLPALKGRVLGRDDNGHQGYRAHRELLRRLREDGRILPCAI